VCSANVPYSSIFYGIRRDQSISFRRGIVLEPGREPIQIKLNDMNQEGALFHK